ncbi:hypothetical protein ACTFIY_001496 [Dictyostelium cf. discoideum]
MDQLIKSGLESLLNIKIDENQNQNFISYKDYSSIIHGVNHEQNQINTKIEDNVNSKMFISTDNITILIRHLSGKTYEMKSNFKCLISEIKNLFFKNFENSIKPSEMVLNYNGHKLDNNKQLGDYNIRDHSTLTLYFENSTYSIDPNTFDPGFNYDFTTVADKTNSFVRGGHYYQRPCGSFRFALKVLGRFNEPMEEWLGQTGKAGGSEWAVSYHSSLYEENCVTTPSFDMAKKNAFTFTHNGIKYYLLFQNRINPSTFKREMIKNEEFWKSPNSSSQHIRPYSICIGRA